MVKIPAMVLGGQLLATIYGIITLIITIAYELDSLPCTLYH